jgi:hypothetical protein
MRERGLRNQARPLAHPSLRSDDAAWGGAA